MNLRGDERIIKKIVAFLLVMVIIAGIAQAETAIIDAADGYIATIAWCENKESWTLRSEGYDPDYCTLEFDLREGWKATVRPPRLGGDRRLGVFATRSPFRPVPIGLSAVQLEGVAFHPHGKLLLKVRGLDLVDGTPVLDIKPYLPYADAITGATGGFAPDAPENALKVTVAPEAAAVLERRGNRFRELCLNVVSGDPRPAYQRIPGREYQCYLEDCEIVWQAGEQPDEAKIMRVNEHTTPRPMPPKVF